MLGNRVLSNLGATATVHMPSPHATPVSPSNTPAVNGKLTSLVPNETEFDFIRHVDHHMRDGLNGRSEIQQYVSTEALDEYWTTTQVKTACVNYGLKRVTGSHIRSKYIRVFSTLVYHKIGYMIEHFMRFDLNDHVFPCVSLPARMLQGNLFKGCLQVFQDSQWKFFPLNIPFRTMHECEIPLERILPISWKEPVSGNKHDSACVYRIRLDPGCSGVEDDRTSSLTIPHKTFALKTYQGSHSGARDAYKREVGFFATLDNTETSGSFIKSYGQYEQGDTLNIVLEFMDLGSLTDYMRNNPRPQTAEEIIDLWESMQGLLDALSSLHQGHTSENQNENENENEIEVEDPYIVLHRDIKPDNILLSRVPGDNQPGDSRLLRCVIGDPGCSEVFAAHTQDGLVSERPTLYSLPTGDQMYCAPEACRQHAHFKRSQVSVTSRSDIFSLGAVWSEFAAWTVFGYEGVLDYRQKRAQEHKSQPGHVNTGHEGCFHDRSRALQAVKNMLSEARRNACGAGHTVTEDIIELIQHYMLCPDPKERLEAPQLYEKFVFIIREAREGRSKSPMTPDFHITSHHPSYDGTQLSTMANALGLSPTEYHSPPASLPNGVENGIERLSLAPSPSLSTSKLQRKPSTTESLTMGQLLRWREDEKSPEHKRRTPRSVLKTIDKLRKNLKDRDHMFLVVDSPSLGDHRGDVNDAFLALSYLAKKMDDDGIELAYASSATSKLLKGAHTTRLIQNLERHPYEHDPAKTEASFDGLIRKHVVPRLEDKASKPLSLYIFTDGAWGDDFQSSQANGVDLPIRDLIDRLRRHHWGRTHLMLQFISFGNDPAGLEALSYLDNFLDNFEGGKWDICDTTHFTGNVYKMFYGSINRGVDRDQPDAEGTVASPTPDSANRLQRTIHSPRSHGSRW